MDKNIPKLFFDRHQLRRAILDLVRNSEEAMPHGGDIQLQAALIDGSINITVRDTGGGIASEDLDHIFDPFFTTKDFGTGLGLALTQQIVNEHGGSIHCESQAGEGTTFTIALPLGGAQETTEESIE